MSPIPAIGMHKVRPQYADVDLTLSHAWDSSVWRYPVLNGALCSIFINRRAHLYEGKQKLYVNRGFGFIGYPGRVGILPGITVMS